MTYDPEAAERLARNLDPETSWTIRLTADDARDAAALIRAQAAEIERLRVERDDPLPPCPSCGGSKIEDTARASAVVCADCGWAAATRGEWRRVAFINTPAESAGDEREAMVAVIAKARGHFTPSEMAWAGDGYHDEDRAIADALLAAGWTHKREAHR